MKTSFSSLLRYLPLIIGIVIVVVALPLIPWGKVTPYLVRLSPLAITGLVICSALFYFGRILRYWLMLRMLETPVSLDRVALACLEAQPVSVLPAGEFYRGAMLKRYGNVSLRDGAPSVFAQSIAETVGLLALALISTGLLHRFIGVLFIIAVIFTAIMAFIRWQNTRQSHKLVNRLPWVNISRGRLSSFLEKNRHLLTGTNFFKLLAASYVSTFAGIAMIIISTHALGINLGPLQALIAYALPVLLEVVSFLPGGLGVTEGGSIGVYTLFGVGLAPAVALTLIIRFFTLGIGFFYGFAAFIWARSAGYKQYD